MDPLFILLLYSAFMEAEMNCVQRKIAFGSGLSVSSHFNNRVMSIDATPPEVLQIKAIQFCFHALSHLSKHFCIISEPFKDVMSV